MTGITTILNKEFQDHVSDSTFLIVFAAFLVAMVGGSFHLVNRTQDLTSSWLESGYLSSDQVGWKYLYYHFPEYVISQITSIGILVAIVLSYNSINKERKEGSLKVLLSYPVNRDKIILGKLIAGTLVLTIVCVLSSSVLMFFQSVRSCS